MLRGLAVVSVLLAACGARATTGPAWPKSAGDHRVGEAEDDGGQSLEPRVPQAVVAIEQSADDDAAAAPAAPAPAAKPAENGGGAAPATPPATGDDQPPVMLDFEEEIIIDGGPQP